jgi:hypothetical protein
MAADSDSVPPPTQASVFGRIFHTVVALVGWVMFVWWWWIVFQRVSSQELRFTAIFIGVSLVVVVAVTAAWAWHNVQIFRRRGPRKQVRPAAPRFVRDRVGRAVSVTTQGPGLRESPVVLVRIVGLGKSYQAAGAIPPAPPSDHSRRGA